MSTHRIALSILGAILRFSNFEGIGHFCPHWESEDHLISYSLQLRWTEVGNRTVDVEDIIARDPKLLTKNSIIRCNEDSSWRKALVEPTALQINWRNWLPQGRPYRSRGISWVNFAEKWRINRGKLINMAINEQTLNRI